jgi:hypothetical protein
LLKPKKLIAWSYSRLSIHRECPAKFRFKFILKLPEPPSPPMERGLAVHKLLESHVKTRTAPPTLGKEFAHLRPELRTIRDRHPECELELAFKRDWERVDWFDPSVWCRVKIDVTHDLEKGAARTLDYKTGQIRPEAHEESLRLYGLATLLRRPELKRLETGAWYVDHEKKPRVLGVYEDNLRRFVQDEQRYWEEQAAPLNKDKRFAATPSRFACGRCAYSCRRTDSAGRPGPCADAV